MAEYLIQSESLDAIADAINAKTGGSSAMTPAEMVTEIEGISGGGGAFEVSPLVTTSSYKNCVESLLNAVIAEIGDKPFLARWISGDVPVYCLYALYYIPQSITQLTVTDDSAGYYISTVRIEKKTFPSHNYFAWHRADWEKTVSNVYSYNISANSVYEVADLSELFGV